MSLLGRGGRGQNEVVLLCCVVLCCGVGVGVEQSKSGLEKMPRAGRSDESLHLRPEVFSLRYQTVTPPLAFHHLLLLVMMVTHHLVHT